MTLTEFLTWLASSGGAAVAVSFILERIAWFQEQTASDKQLVTLVASAVLALTSYVILTFTPPEILAQVTPIFAVIYGVVYTWIFNQVAHTVDPQKAKNAERARQKQADGELPPMPTP